MNAKPNVLFIICDDLNNAIQGLGRQPCAPAPNLQKLMSRSVTFTNSQNNCPICLPSRDCLFSGLYPHHTGSLNLWDNWQWVMPLNTTQKQTRYHGQHVLRESTLLPEHLKAAGYDTFGVGKLLHQGLFIKPEIWTQYGEGPNYGPWLFDAQTGESCGHPRNRKLVNSPAISKYIERYAGIDHFFIDDDRLRYPFEMDFGSTDEYYKASDQIDVYYDNKKSKRFHYVSETDRDLLPDENDTQWAVNKLQEKHDKPFFLGVGYMKPHTPMIVPPSFIEQFPLDEIQLPEKIENDIADCVRTMVDHRPYGFAVYQSLIENGTQQYKRWLQAYLACVAYIDHQVGLLSTLWRTVPIETTRL
ncbi:MAG: sulfatase-like hydrolase/transferase [Phycisphaeraceae bacterium]|nr:sulfatase-like hydrolase/transferase [Phycisphaeraceae bacterium]